MSKKFLIALPLVALMAACGSGGTGTENSVKLPDPKTEEFPKLKFGDNTIVTNGVVIGMTIDDVRKLHKGESPDSDEDGYLTYRYPLGPEDYDHEYLIEYAYDSETNKLWKVHYDISMPDNASGLALYNDIKANLEARFGAPKKVTDDPDWDEYTWKAEIGGQKTDISIQRMKESEAGYLLLYFEEPWE